MITINTFSWSYGPCHTLLLLASIVLIFLQSTKKKPTKEEKRPTLTNPMSRDPNEDAGSGWAGAAKIVDLSVIKKLERMCNQNTFDDVAQDFKYWDDPSDQFKEGEGSLLPLWKLTYDKARKRTVTCMAWSTRYWDLMLVGYGSYDYTKQASGLVCAYSLKNPSYPEYIISTEVGVMCLDVHPEQPSLIAVGFYNGEVAVYDLRCVGRRNSGSTEGGRRGAQREDAAKRET